MIDSLLKVIEKGIDLVNTKQNNNKQYFEFIVKPLFVDVEKVAGEYFNLFSIYGIAPEAAEDIRRGYIQTRIKITELARKYQSESSDPDLIEFFNSISEFFYGSFIVPEDTCKSYGSYYIEILTGKRTFSKFDSTPSSLKEMQEELQGRWARIVRTYGGLQLKYGTPIGYKA